MFFIAPTYLPVSALGSFHWPLVTQMSVSGPVSPSVQHLLILTKVDPPVCMLTAAKQTEVDRDLHFQFSVFHSGGRAPDKKTPHNKLKPNTNNATEFIAFLAARCFLLQKASVSLFSTQVSKQGFPSLSQLVLHVIFLFVFRYLNISHLLVVQQKYSHI